MKLKLVNILIDDHNDEVREGDEVIIKTEDMKESALALVLEIQSCTFTIEFTQPHMGYRKKVLRPSDVLEISKYNKN